MRPLGLPSAQETDKEIAALIETLHSTGQRLEQLTAGEVDGVADREGRTFLLRHAQEQLRDSEAAKQAAILDALPAHVVLLDARGTIISTNAGWRKFANANGLMGPHYAIGVNYLDVCDRARGADAAEAQQAAAGIRSILAGAAHDFSVEYPCHSPTQRRWFLMTVTPLADDPPHGVVVMHLDMTQRKQAEKALEASKNLLQLVLENVPSRIFWKDPDLRFLGCNAQFAKDAGYSRPDELTGKTDFEMVWQDQAELYRADDRSVLESGIAKLNIIEPQTTPDGNSIWLRTSKLPLRDKDDRSIGILGVYEDITDRKQAEQKLRESEQEFRTLAEAMPQIVWITRADGWNIYFNQHWMDYTGLTLEDSLGHGWNKPFHPDDRQQAWDAWQKATATNGIYSIESRLRRADGMYRWWLVRGVPLLGADGKILKWFGTCTDIHDLKMAGLEIAHANGELRESERRFSDMLGNVELVSMMLDREARITYCNDFLLRLTGWQRDEVIGRNWFDLFVPPENGELKASFFPALLADQPEVRHHDNEILTRSGERRLIRWNNSVLRLVNGEVAGVASIGEDITEQRRAEARILRLNRVYAVQSGINALIVRVHDRDELFAEACRIAVEAGAFRTAWIGVIDPQTLDGRIVAWHGADQDFVNSIKLTARSATMENEPPACRALRQGQTVICNDIATEPSLAARREVLLQRGYRSMGCFPLTLDGRPEAVIALFAGEPDYFDSEEVKLLTDLAANLSFALDNLEHEKALKTIEALRQQGEESLKRFSSAMDATADAIYLVDRSSMRFIHVNDAACRMQGKSRAELLALGPMALLATSRAELERTYDEIIASGADAEPLELLRSRKDGSQAWVELRSHAQRSGERWTIITLVRDITERKRVTEELRESESRFRGLTALSTDWYWQQDETLRFVEFSGGDHVKGWGADQMTWVGKRRWEIPGIKPLNGDWTEHRALLEARKPFRNFEYQRQDADGALRYVTASGEPIFAPGGAFAGYRGVATDITERKATDNRIRRLNRVYAVLSGINTLIVRVRNRDELFREACRIAVDAGGFRMSMLCMVDRSAMTIVPVASAGKDEFLFSAVKEVLSSAEVASKSMVGRAIAQKVAIVSNDVRDDPQLLLGNHYRNAEVRSLAVLPLVVADIAIGTLVLYSEELDFFDEEEMKLLTELAGDIGFAIDHIDKRERLDYLAYYDVLTGLANRNLFVDRVTQYLHGAVSGGHKLAVVLIDLERFKNINDSLGQAAGDSLLKQVTAWLSRIAGDVNLLARIGADHFAAVMPEIRQEGDLTHLIEKTLAAFLDHPFRLNDAVFRVAVKIGVALFPDDGADAETLFRNAEAALKQAKASGERYLFYTQQMNASVAVKVTLENQLRQALDNEEFVLHYQPKVNLASGKVVGAEALIRWNDPRSGLVPPGRFIPILEETGLIYEVGRWALGQAIADYLRWHAAGLPVVRIAVNVSPLQLRHRGFIDEIRHAVAIDPQAAAGLELEITESLIMEDVMHSIASLQAIRDMGISVAIDDFGTGFSSLSYLAKLPVDTLKIDRSFVVDMTAGPQGLALVATIVDLAHALKLKVVAEGVETEEQSRLLRLLACDEMQGFLFSQPLPVEIFEARYLAPSAGG